MGASEMVRSFIFVLDYVSERKNAIPQVIWIYKFLRITIDFHSLLLYNKKCEIGEKQIKIKPLIKKEIMVARSISKYQQITINKKDI